jgi:hypothetical protein
VTRPTGHLLAQEREELPGLGQPAPAGALGIERVEPPGDRLLVRGEHGELGSEEPGPEVVVVEDVEVAAGARLPLPHEEADLHELTDRPADRGGADLKPLGQLGGGVPVGVVGQGVGEDPGRHRLHPGLAEHQGEALHEPQQRGPLPVLGRRHAGQRTRRTADF